MLDQINAVSGKVVVASLVLMGTMRFIVLVVQVVTWAVTGNWVPFR